MIDDGTFDIEELKEQLLDNVEAVKKTYNKTPRASPSENLVRNKRSTEVFRGSKETNVSI